MSQQSIIYGYIQGAEWMASDPHKLHRLNRKVLESLPADDPFPPLTRGMFAAPDDDPRHGAYRSQVIHFGASLKEAEPDWRKWLEKFEALLRRLYWFNASVHLRSELVGDQQYDWTVDAGQIVHFFSDPPVPATKWFFDGGPRSFEL